MSSPDDTNDRELLEALGAVLDEIDPVPEFLADAARMSLSWRTVDAELAELTADSALEGPAVRSARAPRMLTFDSDVATVVIEVTADVGGATRQLLGQILHPRPAEVQIRHLGGSVTVSADEHGRFRVAGLPPGLIRLACRFGGAAQPQLITSWVTI
ncbi:MAG: hypothetical protein ICV70_06370 [Jiangellaceae bacterium]|nr:hypothetical protein [Jiangellaceae bacterium]